jgi:ribosomal protein S18 acetylase RimI-like enzyme
MFETIDTTAHISNIRALLNCSFQTVMDELHFTRQMLPGNPAFLDEKTILRQMGNRNIAFYGLWENSALISCYALEVIDTISANLERVCVHPDKRHQGIGLQLLNDSVNRAANFNLRKIQITVINEHLKLKNLYRAFGYRETALKKFEHLPFTVCYMEYDIKA